MNFESLLNTPTKRGVLLNLIKNKYSTRVELAKQLEVTTAAMTNISKELIDNDILVESGEIQDGKVGRRQKRLTLSSSAFYSIGLEITLNDARLIFINAKLSIIFEKTWSFEIFDENVLNSIIEVINKVCLKIDRSKILGVGLLLQGAVKNGGSISMPIKDIKQKLEFSINQEVFICNNIRGLAIVESFLEKSTDNFLLVKYGPGIGGVISVNGNVLEGKHNKAGEIGHIEWNPNSKQTCPICHKRGCLESEIHFRNLNSPIPYTNENNSVNKKKEILKSNRELLKKYIYELGKAISYAVELIDPDSLIIAGLVFTDDSMFKYLTDVVTKFSNSICEDDIRRINNYEKKSSKASAIVVLSEKLK